MRAQQTPQRPENNSTHSVGLISSHSLQIYTLLLESNSLNHTRTHGSVMYAGRIWAAAEQKRRTLCGLIASKIMSTAERRSHYRAARTPNSISLHLQQQWSQTITASCPIIERKTSTIHPHECANTST